jgi:hypothetical protein
MLPQQMHRFLQGLPGALRFQSQHFRGASVKRQMPEWFQSLQNEQLLMPLPLMFLELEEELSW